MLHTYHTWCLWNTVKHLQFFVRKTQQTNEKLQVVVYQEKSYTIHVWYLFIYIWLIFVVNVGKYIGETTGLPKTVQWFAP